MRLRYRYIDLRKTAMLEKMKVRRDVTRNLRNFLDAEEFFEMETPILTYIQLGKFRLSVCT
jgi:aspartyl-tRNA synthetase